MLYLFYSLTAVLGLFFISSLFKPLMLIIPISDILITIKMMVIRIMMKVYTLT